MSSAESAPRHARRANFELFLIAAKLVQALIPCSLQLSIGTRPASVHILVPPHFRDLTADMPRVARKAASSAISPTASPSKGSKRQVDSTEPSSPLRRSKRTKSHEGLPNLEVKEELEQDEGTSSNAALKRNARGRAVKVPIKEETIAEEVTSVAVADEEAQTKVEKTEEPAPAVTTTKKRKTKKEIEAEMVPLRARTQGLRMCVGAHVSAAKGVFNSINNSVHIGYAACLSININANRLLAEAMHLLCS